MAALDILNLGFKVDTTQVKSASKDIDNLGKSAKNTGDSFKKLDKNASDSVSGVASLSKSVKILGAAYIALQSTQAIAGIIDEQTKLNAQLKLATRSQDDYNKALKDVQRISFTAQASVASIATLYARLSQSLGDAGASMQTINDISENVALSLKIGGASAGEASSVMLQLSQAFASGTLRGDEFNSMAENAPNLMRVLAQSMGVTVGSLRSMAAEGQVTSLELMKAFGNPELLKALRIQAQDVNTLSGAWGNFWEQIKGFTGEFAKQSGAIDLVTQAMNGLSRAIKAVRDATTKKPLTDEDQQKLIGEKFDLLQAVSKKGFLGGTTFKGQMITEYDRVRLKKKLEEELGYVYGQNIGGSVAITPQTSIAPNFGATTGITDVDKLHQKQKELSDKRKQALAEEKDMMKSLVEENQDLNIKLIENDKERVLEQLKIEHERKVAIIQNTFDIGEAQNKALIKEQENYQLRIKINSDVKDSFEDLKNAIQGFGKDATNAIVDFAFGAKTSFSDMINSMLRDLARMMIQKQIMDPIVASLSASMKSGGGGFFSDIFSGFTGAFNFGGGAVSTAGVNNSLGNLVIPSILTGGARANGGSVMPNKTYMVGEQGAELFVPKTAGSIVPNHALGGGQVNNVSITINESGNRSSSGDNNKLSRQIENAVVKVLIDQKRQGGVYA